MRRCSDKTSSHAKWAHVDRRTDQTVAAGRSPDGGPLRDERPAHVRFGMRDRDVDVGNRAPPRTTLPASRAERRAVMR